MTAGGERRWVPPRTRFAPVGSLWSDWARRLHHLAGGLERDLDAEQAVVVADLERLIPLDEAALDRAIDAARARVRRIGTGPCENGDSPHPLAVAAVAAARTVGLRAYPVQLRAAMGMSHGCAVQMAAGEGKTLSVALAGVLEGWLGRVCHLVTANDYLAARDAELMRPLFSRCGLVVAAVQPEMDPADLRRAYDADVVYATGKQLLADFLRDQLLLGGASDSMGRMLHALRGSAAPSPVTRGLYSAIVDEADSVLIDDATTPLIISAPEPDSMLEEAVQAARIIVDELEPERDYLLDLVYRDLEFTEAGEARLEPLMDRLAPIWHVVERRDELLTQAVLARDVFERDRHYIVDEGKVVIVDENTGRAMPGRSWSYGLHQAIEAREEVEISPPSKTLARMSFQHFFQLYHRLAGASGTLQGIRGELWGTYRLLTLTIPTRVPSRLEVPPTACFAGREDKWQDLIDRVIDCHGQGLPVLVGTRRISDSERLQEDLEDRGIRCAILNAKQLEQEAEVIAAAGERGRVTVATNMAGRGTDIKVPEAVIERGGLQVFMLDPHESARVDWQLFGRAGRHGSPGRAQALAALDDDLLGRHLPLPARPLVWLAGRQLRHPALVRLALQLAQQRAQRRARVQRVQLQRRELLLREQLSFAGGTDLAAEAVAGAARGRRDDRVPA